jgi:hypothetical protein
MNNRLFRWEGSKTRGDVFVGVVIQRLDGDQMHAGLLYRTKIGGEPYVVHLKGHLFLLHTPPVKGQVCIVPPIEEVRLPALAAFIKNVYRKNRDRGIPYAFSSPDHDWFSSDGALLLSPDRLGLTCSSFVLAVFRAAGLPLVDLKSWPIREEDKEWQKHVLKIFKGRTEKKAKRKEHVQRMRTEIGAIRCRPLEVGGAALATAIPCDFREATENSKAIERML